MSTRITIAAAILLTTVAVAQAEPSLEETLAWMYGTYHNAGHGQIFYNSHVSGQQRLQSHFSYSGCEITLYNFHDYGDGKTSDQTSQFTLRDIDQSSIKLEKTASQAAGALCTAVRTLPCDKAELSFKTINISPLIKQETRINYYNGTGTDMVHFAYLVFDDPDYAERFTNAFRHAVKLCGGKAAPF